MSRFSLSVIRAIIRGLALSLAICVQTMAAEPAPVPVNPQPAADALKPGLTVDYYYAIFDWIDELVSAMAGSDPDPGEVITQLNFRSGEDNVLTSQKRDGVGAHIRGLIYLDTAGEYSLVAHSNDGVRIMLGGVRIIEDPDVHSDQFSRIVNVMVDKPAWYELEVLYFEKRNTSTLRLMWKKPGSAIDAEMTVVPADAYAHVN